MNNNDNQEPITVPVHKLPTTFSASDLMTWDLPTHKWAVPGLVPEGLSILAGNPKLGKSWWALGVSLAVASGTDVLGNIAVEAGEVHYMALEDGPRRLQTRLRAMLRDQPVPDNLTFSTEWPPLDKGGDKALENWLATHTKTRLVIVDTFTKIRPSRGNQNDVYRGDYDHMGKLKSLADDYGVAIVAVHHSNKAGAKDDFLEAVSGSYGLSGAADSTLLLTRSRGDDRAVLKVTGRDVLEQELALKWEENSCTWTIQDDVQQAYIDPEYAKVIAVLDSSEQPMSPKEVAPLIGKTEENTRQLLARMAKRGLIKKTGYGKYTSLSHSSHSCHSKIETENKEPSTLSTDQLITLNNTITQGQTELNTPEEIYMSRETNNEDLVKAV